MIGKALLGRSSLLSPQQSAMSWTLLGKDTKLSLLSASAIKFLGPLIYLIVGPNLSISKKPPSHNVLSIEVFIGEIFVVGIHHYLLSQKDVFVENFDDR